MVEENAEYFRRAPTAMLDGIALARQHGDYAAADSLLSVFHQFLLFRLVLNPHPWLTGIAAGRFARYTGSFAQEQRLTAALLWNVLWPSATLHASTNLAGGFLGRIVNIGITAAVFANTWRSLEDAPEVKRVPPPGLGFRVYGLGFRV
ncbi:unnamed protein product [Symbiodinium natans]|uniref:Uncharacterized protein n=1 Tax=Symbiodinium natans TaxID=878477 RepID=A0A812UU27_9DINO|nr:unnamed protein product [Symbiodinium natans]